LTSGNSTLCGAHPNWGSPSTVGELGKLGIDVAKSTVDKYRIRPTGAPPPTKKAFLENPVHDLVSIDFFVVPTVGFEILYVLIVLAHDRRRVMHFNVSANPTAQWTAQQMVEAFPFDTAPRYRVRDRDSFATLGGPRALAEVFGTTLSGRLSDLGDRSEDDGRTRTNVRDFEEHSGPT